MCLMNACLKSQVEGYERTDNKRTEVCPRNLRAAIFVAKRNLLQLNEDASDISKATR